MTSNINANNIDGTYPVAGVDNDSQGFRTNFTNIKNNFIFAKNELTDLQNKVLLKSALTGSSLDNNMSGAIIASAEIKDFRETRFDHGSTSGTVVLNHANAHYHTVSTTDDISLAFSNLPAAGKLGRIRLDITITNTSHSLELPVAVSLGTVGIAGFNSNTNTINFKETGSYIFEFTTDDAGTTIHIADLSRPRDYFYSEQIRLAPRVITDARGQSTDIAGMIAIDTITPAIWVAVNDYDGTTLIWRKAELETRDNEVFLASDATTTSSSLSDIGLSFSVEPSTRYNFEAFIPFTHSDSSTNTHTFTIKFDSGTCYASIEQQAGPTSAPSVSTISTSDATTSTVTTSSTSVKMCKITGSFISGATGYENVRLRFSTSGGTLAAKAGAYLRFNRK
jgi:hypothetical protein